MQVQRDFPTIEGYLFEALAKAGFIMPDDVLSPVRFSFQRAARTDRCVSAVRQMCSLRLGPEDQQTFPKTAPDQINKYLPKDIRVLGVRRAIRSFVAHKHCDKRTYSYTLPTYAFAPMDKLTTSAYRIDDSTVAEINEILSLYKGTHNFFNYTSGKSYDDRSSNRYIHEFKCGEIQLHNDELRGELVEFMTLYITGQSFMLHQIRKMIAMVIATARGLCGRSEIMQTFERDRMDVPKAPGLGLVLEKVHYECYDRWYQKTHEKLDDWGEEVDASVKDFRQKMIIDQILTQELETQSMFLWLTNLIKHDLTALDKTDDQKSPLVMASIQASLAQKRSTEAEEQPDDSDIQQSLDDPTVPALEASAEQNTADAPINSRASDESLRAQHESSKEFRTKRREQ